MATQKKTTTKTRKTARKAASKTSRKSTARKSSTSRAKTGGKTAKKATSKKTASKTAPRKTAKKATARKATAPKTSSKAKAPKTSRPSKPKSAPKTTSRSTARKSGPAKAKPRATGGKAPTKPATPAKAADGDDAPKRQRKPKPKQPYSKSQLRPMYKALIERRLRLAADLNLMGDEALRAADPDVDTESVADHGSDAYERNLTLGLMEHDSRTLRQIDTALSHMEEGTYGLCAECDEPIPLARLEALPFATTCVPCQQKQEGYL